MDQQVFLLVSETKAGKAGVNAQATSAASHVALSIPKTHLIQQLVQIDVNVSEGFFVLLREFQLVFATQERPHLVIDRVLEINEKVL